MTRVIFGDDGMPRDMRGPYAPRPTPEQRAALAARVVELYADGRTIEATAAIVGRPYSTVRRLLLEGRRTTSHEGSRS